MTFSEAISAISTPLAEGPKKAARPKDASKNERLSWKGRHVDLKPKCCQRNSIRKIISAILLGLGLVLAGGAVFAALTFVALPSAVIGLTATLAAFGGTFFITGLTISLLPRSWNDPSTRILRGKQAEDKISKNNLSYPQIRKQYGNQIDNYQILNNEDLNLLLRKDLSRENLPYETLITRHGKGLLKILDEKNREVVRQKFLAFLTPPTSLKTVVNSYSEDVKALQITAQEISALLETYIETLDYEAFERKNGIEFLAADWIYTPKGNAPSKLLNAEARDSLKLSFLGFIKTKDINLADAKKIFARDITLLNVSEEELIAELSNRDLQKTLKGDMKYLDFLKRNEVNGMRGASEELINDFRKGLLSEISRDEIGMAELQEKYQPELAALQIENSDLANVTIHRDLSKLEQQILGYLSFKKNHGLEGLEAHLGQKKPVAHQAFLNMPYTDMKAVEYQSDRVFFGISNQEIFDSVKSDLETLSYEAFKLKHSLAWISDPLCTPTEKNAAADKLINQLKNKPYSKIKPFLCDFEQLNVSTSRLAKLMEGEFMEPFEQIIKKHGSGWLAEVPTFKTDAELKSLLAKAALEYVVTYPISILTNRSATGSLLLEHHLLVPAAENIVNDFQAQYEVKAREIEQCIEGVKAHNYESIQAYQHYLGNLEHALDVQEGSLKKVEASYYHAKSCTQKQHHEITNCKTKLKSTRQRVADLQTEVFTPSHLKGLRDKLEALQGLRNSVATTPVKGLRAAEQVQKQIRALEERIHHLETLPHQLAAERTTITQLNQQISFLEDQLPSIESVETKAFLHFSQCAAEVGRMKQQFSKSKEETRQSLLQIQRDESEVESTVRKDLQVVTKKLANELKSALKRLK